jgi:hypothetical protein
VTSPGGCAMTRWVQEGSEGLGEALEAWEAFRIACSACWVLGIDVVAKIEWWW